MILLIDNYDSFSYNLYQYVGMINPDIRVIKNDELSLAEIAALAPDHIIVSPGPGRPADAGICEEVIEYFKDKTPILGVCLGHQAICEVFGGTVTYASTLMHGKQSTVHIANGSPIFRGLPPIIAAGRYHSLSAERSTLPDELLIIAEDDEGEVMAVKHRSYNVYGVQFHPESILTEAGHQMIENFLKIGGEI
ncbi:aminodeoxychorismate/anthranilate synthase component II [Acetobacterium wieringae]|jgi:anthranilate synthase component 2|uniref:Aminodeoxychorismate synthase component 2 n=1 Tax=Acetobacterium wieringae TaxID=52694 RepID=A0A1F2PMR9_9FIRM|nr:aminodeoxychorismate/anthranilate synthase component II [Acetobacterium wieringae]OFV72032.1 aminodeoxychorismate synthase component 2 [Acetobacterium wieringae]URN82826.1 aminodeoxychorismate/anthranilate synthase component II [Acetobacterium wieringae]UYO61201.1 aminodeoxychorismate/anthranilate synthase component II [Acetobacterium wieringae]VUZ29134.1 Aminodeoxychorismate synthase component 2 [Acetobacterium wieringae]